MNKNKRRRKGEIFLSAECQLTNVEEMIQSVKRSFDKHRYVYPQMLTGMGYLRVASKCLPMKFFINCKEK